MADDPKLSVIKVPESPRGSRTWRLWREDLVWSIIDDIVRAKRSPRVRR